MRKRARVALALVCARTPGLVALEVAGVRRRAPLASGLVWVLGWVRARACVCMRACAFSADPFSTLCLKIILMKRKIKQLSHGDHH